MKRGNKDIVEKITESIKKGNGRVAACKAAGLNYQTFLNWLNPLHNNYDLEFLEAIKKAENQGREVVKETCVNVIINAATDKEKPVWQAAAWMLERKFPEDYGNRQSIDHSNKDGTLRELSVKVVKDEVRPSDDWGIWTAVW